MTDSTPVSDPAPAGPVTVSVAMATYNGASYVEEQLASILAELGPCDEVVVVDDASTDDTVERLARVEDPRVRLVRADVNQGYVRAFEQALGLARGEVVLLADQDDVWVPGRVSVLTKALESHQVVASNLATLGGADGIPGPFGRNDWRLRSRDEARHVLNVLGIWAGLRPYYGCAMGVRRDALAMALPFPHYLDESHDLWLALYGNLAGSISHVETRTVRRRIHDANATPVSPRGLLAVLRSRLLLLRATLHLRSRLRRR
ncbi:glycosyltransferase [Nocardioides sp. 616]|uniref:glycosyltransferase n=1 Tax=Nocardioides sp. 616 TaxID=2268090 RepID=UPI0019660283|nr:glycosyltransferase [Nocardioides sp. 616]